MYKKLILGPPGTGKTTRLLQITEEKLQCMPPERIAFFSFTKKAISEAVSRACTKFNLEEKRFKNFRTIHSVAYREMGLNPGRVLDHNHFKKLEALSGFKLLSKNYKEEELTEKGDKFIFLNEKSRNMKKSLRELWEDNILDINWRELEYFVNILNAYKKEHMLIDWADMLENYLKHGKPLNIDIAFIDEGQDLSPLQWNVINLIVQNVKELYIAGDDDQAIYRWSGADIHQFLNLQVTEKEVLPISYRLPSTIHDFANKISNKIKERYIKKWSPRNEKGIIQYHNELEKIKFEGEWLILGRSNYQLKEAEKFIRERKMLYSFKEKSSVHPIHLEMIQGYVVMQKGNKIKDSTFKLFNKYYNKDIQWFDALKNISYYNREYYRALLREGIKLNDEPKIHINTIHGSKGGESEKVLVITDLAKQVYDNYMKNGDDEHRVFYVACTRAKKELHILMPQTELFYSF